MVRKNPLAQFQPCGTMPNPFAPPGSAGGATPPVSTHPPTTLATPGVASAAQMPNKLTNRGPAWRPAHIAKGSGKTKYRDKWQKHVDKKLMNAIVGAQITGTYMNGYVIYNTVRGYFHPNGKYRKGESQWSRDLSGVKIYTSIKSTKSVVGYWRNHIEGETVVLPITAQVRIKDSEY